MKAAILTGASALDRNSTDFYPTPANVTCALADYLNLSGKTVWEPACGAGHMAEALKACGATVIATELHGQGYGEQGVDFLNAPLPACEWIVTNPPFKLAEQFIRRCIAHGVPFAMLLKSQYWHSARRMELFMAHQPAAILPLTLRPDFHFGTKGGSPTMECAWTIWNAEPALRTEYLPLARPANDSNQKQKEVAA